MNTEAPALIGDIVESDCAELRDLAKYFEDRGKSDNAKFLRDVATRHEVMFGAYWTQQSNQPQRVEKFMDDLTGKELYDAGF